MGYKIVKIELLSQPFKVDLKVDSKSEVGQDSEVAKSTKSVVAAIPAKHPHFCFQPFREEEEEGGGGGHLNGLRIAPPPCQVTRLSVTDVRSHWSHSLLRSWQQESTNAVMPNS